MQVSVFGISCRADGHFVTTCALHLRIRHQRGEHAFVYSWSFGIPLRVLGRLWDVHLEERCSWTHRLVEPAVLEKHDLEDTTGNCVKQISSGCKFCSRHWEKQDSCSTVCGALCCSWTGLGAQGDLLPFLPRVLKGGENRPRCLLVGKKKKKKKRENRFRH